MNDRNPLWDTVKSTTWVPLVLALISGAASFGIIDATQAKALSTAAEFVAAALVAVITAITAVVHAITVAFKAHPLVTPSADPRDNNGNRLVPDVPRTGGGQNTEPVADHLP